MAENCAIVIGINGYYNGIQPLNYAKTDAERVRDYFQHHLSVKPNYLKFFCDDSPRETQPTYTTLKSFLYKTFQTPFLEPGDTLWFYFSGHGMPYAGQDYLLPIDGDPSIITESAISITYITERLRRSGADNIVLFIDACRSTGEKSAGLGIGEEKQQGVITFYSCSPNQVSYEIEEIQQGAFTHVLLKGLQIQGEGNCATVERLYNYLLDQVPQLTQKHKKYTQTPYAAIEPPTKLHYILLPKFANLSDIDKLAAEAAIAEAEEYFALAFQIWMRVNVAAGGTDMRPIRAFQRLANKQSSNILEQRREAEAQGQKIAAAKTRELTVDLGQGLPLELVRVPAGKFMMGMPPEERQIALEDALRYGIKRENAERWLDWSTPQHEVYLQEFLMGKYAVTNAQWYAVMKTKPSEKYDKKFQGDKQPVVGVSWHEAMEFCEKLSKQTQRAVRLPTEAEWEYACRAGTTTPFAFGKTITTDQVNYDGNYPYGDAPKGKYRECTVNVDSFQPNAWGLYQMHGNVWEWCLDEFHDRYSEKPAHLKSNGNEPWGELNVSKEDNRAYICRGGSWFTYAINCRLADRRRLYARGQPYDLGFRVVFGSSSPGLS
ncbi:SUMF1/EgtB/PvdO family nonheme iron enzyme [Sphaerospermopsis aphanizomenoides BCCUSP55]|uniref:SUMF1/EgtB/PvdO family nonheme iron enzyme n=1 Tax=Sphaerospermopsis aphanizomenoides TaxID=459663 RepID=UPI000AFC0B97|nr:SUMF1/EgtB/PvdO family nonheme iron enzyme [Sphaerospermopsis aphanizomenoides]MBK1990246.1 SUMF1/EgtB/PvdO family nonheme iron enzyme [Sphaerospermopsis aphanizomenoides BCCUSP55]